MTKTQPTGILLIRENALLPPDLPIESEAFLPGWRVVKNFDGNTLGRRIKEINWTFIRLAGERKARVLGRAGHTNLREGVRQMLSALRGRRFNSLEITAVRRKSFLGLAYLSISASLRHLQDEIPARA